MAYFYMTNTHFSMLQGKCITFNYRMDSKGFKKIYENNLILTAYINKVKDDVFFHFFLFNQQ
jgi:hypothetical protein